jgi:hypothetical protein
VYHLHDLVEGSPWRWCSLCSAVLGSHGPLQCWSKDTRQWPREPRRHMANPTT